MLKILQISDVHGSLTAAKYAAEVARREGVDAIFVAGDITNFGTVEEAEGILNVMAEAGAHLFFVAGNCDPVELLTHRPSRSSIINLHKDVAELKGYTLMGIGGGGKTPSSSTWIEFSEEEFEEIIRDFKRPSRAIIITHNPPYGSNADMIYGRHVGSKAIRRFVEDARPVLVSCGHIHEARSVSKIGTTTIVNAGPAKNGWCAFVDIIDEDVRVTLGRLG